MNGVDIGLFQFDFDLTWACLFMNKNGHTYARYGMRKSEKADEMLSTKGLLVVMKKVLEAHKAGGADKKPAKWVTKTPEQLPGLPPGLKSGKECVHCHQVAQGQRNEQPGLPNRDATKVHPLPENIGLTMDRDNPAMVMSVEPRSAAEKAGIKVKDEILSVNGTPTYSAADISHALNGVPKSGGTVKIEVKREGTETEIVSLGLQGTEWRERDISWRGSMWPLRPAPGFGGPKLSDEELKNAGLPAGAWAIRVNYIVDWGNDPYGKAAQKAGLQKGDIVTAVAGKSDFPTELAMQAWFRLNVKPGTAIAIDILRRGKAQKLQMHVP
jgi:hypothetical protein